MGALLNAILAIGTFIGSVFAYLMYMIEGTTQMISTAFAVIEGLPSYMIFLPAGSIAILGSAFGIHIIRTLFGR